VALPFRPYSKGNSIPQAFPSSPAIPFLLEKASPLLPVLFPTASAVFPIFALFLPFSFQFRLTHY
jgi:hypothetical protein